MRKKLNICEEDETYQIVAGNDLDEPDFTGDVVDFGDTAAVVVNGEEWTADIDGNGECDGLAHGPGGKVETLSFELGCMFE